MDRLLRLHFRGMLHHVTLVLLWLFGLLFGIFLGLYSCGRIPALCYADIFRGRVSLIWLLIFRCSPLFVCIFSHRTVRHAVLFSTIFIKALIFSFAFICLVSAFGSSAWLVSFFLFLGDGLILTAYWWIWLHLVASNFSGIKSAISLASVVIAPITFFDYVFVAPFMATLV